jgi:hypothetical protein
LSQHGSNTKHYVSSDDGVGFSQKLNRVESAGGVSLCMHYEAGKVSVERTGSMEGDTGLRVNYCSKMLWP